MKFQPATWTPGSLTDSTPYLSEFPIRLKLFRWLGRQVWIPRGQDRMLRKLWNPDVGRSFLFEVDFFGFRYRGDMAQYIDWSVFAYGCYSYDELSLLEAITKELRTEYDFITYLDIGANVGHHMLFMAGQADQIIAAEPFPALQQLIRQKIALNHLSHVRLIPYALGESDDILQYYPGGGCNSGTGTFVPEESGTYQEPIEIHLKRGDEVLAALNPGKVHICKVDVEGFECAVFRGLKERIQADRPVILTEITERSRASFGDAESFRACFWEGAIFAEVKGRHGHPFKLLPFHYETASEVLILPPEMGNLARKLMVS